MLPFARSHAAVVLTLFSVSCAKHQSSDLAVAHADAVQPDDPILASIVAIGAKDSQTDSFRPFCTGVLMDADTVLTAAHCLDGPEGEVTLGFGVDMKAPTATRAAVGRRHESYDAPYNEPFSFDLALLKIKGGAPSTAHGLPLMGEGELKVGARLQIAGYGISAPKSGGEASLEEENTALHTTSLKVTRIFDPDADDVAEYGLFVTRTVDGISEVCAGDSGAPVFSTEAGQWKLAGIAVGGYGECNAQSYQTNAAFFNEWILKSKDSIP